MSGRLPGDQEATSTGPAHGQRHVGTQGDAGVAAALLLRRAGQRAVEPARLRVMRPGRAAFQHVLRIEVRALAVWRGHRMCTTASCCCCHSSAMKSSEGCSANRSSRRCRPRGTGRDPGLATQPRVVGIAHRRHRREAIERAPQQHEHEAPLAGGRAGEADARGEHAATGGEASGHGRNAGSVDVDGPWWISSATHEFRRGQQQRQGLRAILRTRDGGARIRRQAPGPARPPRAGRHRANCPAAAPPAAPTPAASAVRMNHPSRRCDPASPRVNPARNCAGPAARTGGYRRAGRAKGNDSARYAE